MLGVSEGGVANRGGVHVRAFRLELGAIKLGGLVRRILQQVLEFGGHPRLGEPTGLPGREPITTDGELRNVLVVRLDPCLQFSFPAGESGDFRPDGRQLDDVRVVGYVLLPFSYSGLLCYQLVQEGWVGLWRDIVAEGVHEALYRVDDSGEQVFVPFGRVDRGDGGSDLYDDIVVVDSADPHLAERLGAFSGGDSCSPLFTRVGRFAFDDVAFLPSVGDDVEADILLEKELLADEKENSEHLMLVDLGRNDLGRVCEPGTVKVHDFRHIERYSHVMHLVSTVTGTLADDATAVDAFAATFPAGTLSGAPKPSALAIIDRLEDTRRGVYGGTVGYFDFRGNTDQAITIRSGLIKDGTVYVQSGGGIVADSDPEAEDAETRNKAAAVLRAVAAAETVRDAAGNGGTDDR